MALTATTLNGAITASQTMIVLTSASGLLNKQLVKVDAEVMRVTDISLSPTIQVVRGYQGTAAVAHNTLDLVAFGAPADFTNTPFSPLTVPNEVGYGVSGAIAIPTANTAIYLSKVGVAAMTLGAPASDQNALTLTITSVTSGAHTVTSPALFQTSSLTTGSIATFTSAAGGSMTIQAQKSLWNVLSTNGVVIT